MLNDIISLVVALYAIKLTSERPADPRLSYGWHRAEILAALVNGVFLVALCFSIALEALERFFHPPGISNPRLVVIVGCLGLAANIGGLLLFHEHGHGHSQSHGHSHSVELKPMDQVTPPTVAPSYEHKRSSSLTSLLGHSAISPPCDKSPEIDIEQQVPEKSEGNGPSHHDHHGHHGHTHSHAGSMNMRALVLHVFGDALGNVGVIAAGLIIWLTSWSFKNHFDPLISLVITVIIFLSAFPLVKSTCYILLQRAPSEVSVEGVRTSILAIDGVLSLHDLHIWQLSESKTVASVHIMASRSHDFMLVAEKIRSVLHHHGVHSSTIQPEYLPQRDDIEIPSINGSSNELCLILCPDDQKCKPENACCAPLVEV
ncbi:hypothetical protein HGRIS_014415 [Hohenbuehelia grisea]|uniref:Cation efflux protein n=1 Tax=Hohenbuehelia grisea TaxID=104357 RepID=A0ABR3JTC1_9AGAR